MIRFVTVAFCFILLAAQISASEKSAWDNLNNLNITEAKKDFLEEREKSPEKLSLMRGLLIAATMEYDYDLSVSMLDSIVYYHPDNPYLIPVFEYFNVFLEGYVEKQNYEKKFGEAILKNSDGALALYGHRIINGYNLMLMNEISPEQIKAVNNAPGMWVAGPFDNTSNITTYRQLPIETDPVDTNAIILGEQGYQVKWTWDNCWDSGELLLGNTFDHTFGDALIATAFFEIPNDTELILIPGGAYSGRFLIDNEKVVESYRHRNSIMREGCLVKLKKGVHRITAVLCDLKYPTSFSISVLDSKYKPIDGFKWLRFGQVTKDKPEKLKDIHPIFDPFNSYIEKNGKDPDTDFWMTMLRNYNGYVKESVSELEKKYLSDDRTSLDVVTLCLSLDLNGEKSRSLMLLDELRGKVKNLYLESSYAQDMSYTFIERVQAFEQIQKEYGHTIVIDLMVSMRALINGDIDKFFKDVDSITKLYPEVALLDKVLSDLYRDSFQDNEKAMEYFKSYCKRCQTQAFYHNQIAWYLMGIKKYDEACKAALATINTLPVKEALEQIMTTHKAAQKLEEIIPLVDSLLEVYPTNADIYDSKYQIYFDLGKFSQADSILYKLHKIKPAAIQPYLSLPELHNNFPLDSVLGSVNAMDYWTDLPDSSVIFENNFWTLFDKTQVLICENGPVLHDIHFATVLLDESAVKSYQNFESPVNLDYPFTKLITVRRLRKGNPALDAQREGSSIIFQDLVPGDAVEIHYRYWTQSTGDLWKHWWSSYRAKTSYFQKNWEYVILTNRDDLQYTGINFPFECDIDTHCGYKRYSWGGVEEKPINSNLWYKPPYDEILGIIYFTTLDSWDAVASWYLSVSDAILSDNPRSNTLADSLTKGISDDLEKVKALYSYTVLQIPYQAIGFDYNASIPHDPDQVLFNSWGDCKDKAFLLVAMLQEADIDAWTVLVRTWDNGTQTPLPQFNFNHLITACVVGSDTLYLDPSGDPFPVGYIPPGIGGQPALQVSQKGSRKIVKLPDIVAESLKRDDTMVVDVKISEPSELKYVRNYFNNDAGYRRGYLKDIYQSELIGEIEGGISNAFNLVTKVDSVEVDSITTVNDMHSETVYGTIELSVQQVGNTTILKPPVYSPISKETISNIFSSGERSYPVDLYWSVSTHKRTVILKLPEDLGEPQFAPEINISDEFWDFNYYSNWDEVSRELILTYNITIKDGQCDPMKYDEFARRINEAYENPLVFIK